MTLSVALVTCGSASSLAGQSAPAPKETQVWALQGLRSGYCVRFLIEPRMAAKQLKRGFALIRADQNQTLHAALRNVIETQPEFASWATSRLCLYYVDAVKLGNRRIVEKDARKYQMIGVWSVATAEKGSGMRRDVVLDMFASREQLVRAAQAARVRLRPAHSAVSDPPDTTAHSYGVKIERTLLVWQGRTTGDSTRVEQPIQESWSVTGVRQSTWAANLAFTPTWSRSLVGSLRVEGKGDLAMALKASPIRFVGPLYSGGGAEVRFSR